MPKTSGAWLVWFALALLGQGMAVRDKTHPTAGSPSAVCGKGTHFRPENSVIPAVRVTELNLKASRRREHSLELCQGQFMLGIRRKFLHRKDD